MSTLVCCRIGTSRFGTSIGLVHLVQAYKSGSHHKESPKKSNSIVSEVFLVAPSKSTMVKHLFSLDPSKEKETLIWVNIYISPDISAFRY